MTKLDSSRGYLVLTNTFTVEPDRAEELLGVLSRATQNGMRHSTKAVRQSSTLPTLAVSG